MSLRDIGNIKECQKTAGHFCTTMPTIGFGPNMEKKVWKNLCWSSVFQGYIARAGVNKMQRW